LLAEGLLVLRLFLPAQGLLLVLRLAQVGLLANGRALVVTIFHLVSLLGWLLLTRITVQLPLAFRTARLRCDERPAMRRSDWSGGRDKKAAGANPDG
jgi:hypothetical protein